MKRYLAFAALVVALGLVATPALAVERIGQVVAIYPEEQAFTLDAEGVEIDLGLGPRVTKELKARFSELKVGDTVRVEVDEQEEIAMAIEILPGSVQPEPWAEPEPGEPRAETMRKDYQQ